MFLTRSKIGETGTRIRVCMQDPERIEMRKGTRNGSGKRMTDIDVVTRIRLKKVIQVAIEKEINTKGLPVVVVVLRKDSMTGRALLVQGTLRMNSKPHLLFESATQHLQGPAGTKRMTPLAIVSGKQKEH